MARYRTSGLVIDSEIPLPGLDPAGAPGAVEDGPPLHIALGAPTEQPHRTDWYCVADDGGFRIAADAARFLVRFEELADLLITRDGRSVTLAPVADLAPSTLHHLICDHAVPLALARRGQPVLHGSAVQLADGSVVAFVGESGRGKSTLAASFLAAGAGLVTDDCAPLRHPPGEPPLVVPSYGSLRLFDAAARLIGAEGVGAEVAHYTDKLRIDIEALGFRRCPQPAALAAVFVVEEPPSLPMASLSMAPLEALPLAAAFQTLTRHAFHLVEPGGQSGPVFAAFARLAAEVPVYPLAYPRRLDVFPALHRLIAQTLGVAITPSPGAAVSPTTMHELSQSGAFR